MISEFESYGSLTLEPGQIVSICSDILKLIFEWKVWFPFTPSLRNISTYMICISMMKTSILLYTHLTANPSRCTVFTLTEKYILKWYYGTEECWRKTSQSLTVGIASREYAFNGGIKIRNNVLLQRFMSHIEICNGMVLDLGLHIVSHNLCFDNLSQTITIKQTESGQRSCKEVRNVTSFHER